MVLKGIGIPKETTPRINPGSFSSFGLNLGKDAIVWLLTPASCNNDS